MFNFFGNLSQKTGAIIEQRRITKIFFFALWKAADTLLWQPLETAKKAPFIRSKIDMKDFMGLVVLLLLFTSVLPAIYFFGWQTVLPRIAISFICGVFIVDVGWAIIIREKDINEGAFVTCTLVPLIFPPLTPLWVIGLASALAILIRNVFGGVGKNIWNPALLARLIIMVSFALTVSTGWKEPFWGIPTQESLRFGVKMSDPAQGVQAITRATPLVEFQNSGYITPWWQLLFGKASGCLGETCRAALLLGGIILCLTKVANWRIPLSFFGSAAALTALMNFWSIGKTTPVEFQLLSGGLVLGALFMATDPVTAPSSHFGKWIFGMGCGGLTVLLRRFTSFPEAVMFSILIMNTFKSPLDWIILQWRLRTRKFGAEEAG